MPQLHRINVYPVKSLDGVSLPVSPVLPSGILAGDRRYRLVDLEGKVMNSKRTARLHPVRAEFGLADGNVTLRDTQTSTSVTLSLVDDREEIGHWFSQLLGIRVVVEENRETGFPDDLDAVGPSLVSLGTLREIASWFPGLTVDEVRQRLRANLEVDAEEPFWEDKLVANPGQRFTIGSSIWSAERVCQRCVVPTRDALTGEVLHRFQRHFAERRRGTLPPWSPARLFNHFYRVAINTRLIDVGSRDLIAVGDRVEPISR